MIVFDKPLNETLEKHVRDHCNLQKRIGLLGTAGFLIGSRVGEDVHVAHIAICPLPETADDRVCFISWFIFILIVMLTSRIFKSTIRL